MARDFFYIIEFKVKYGIYGFANETGHYEGSEKKCFIKRPFFYSKP